MPLPTTKTPPRPGIETKKILIAGAPKIGKSTLAAGLDPDHNLFIATESGLDAAEVYQEPCPSWLKFREIGQDLAKGGHPFKLVTVDTVDELVRMCAEHVIGDMAKSAGKSGYVHPSDFEYGKGWQAVTDEFRLRVAKLCNLGVGVVFLSHLKESTVKTKVGEQTVFSPEIGAKGSREWLLGFVDYIFFATMEGEDRVIRTQPSELFPVTGGRTLRPMPDPLPLDAQVLRAEYEKAMTRDAKPAKAKAEQAAQPVAA